MIRLLGAFVAFVLFALLLYGARELFADLVGDLVGVGGSAAAQEAGRASATLRGIGLFAVTGLVLPATCALAALVVSMRIVPRAGRAAATTIFMAIVAVAAIGYASASAILLEKRLFPDLADIVLQAFVAIGTAGTYRARCRR